jgi:hypothetical protein
MTNLNPNANPADIAKAYIAAWNAADGAERRVLMSRGWREDARYVDPMMRADGRSDIAGMIESARAQFPGLGFSLAGRPDGHGDFVRFSWLLAPDGGEAVAGGTDMIRLDGDGRIAEVVGFLDKAPGL